MSILPCQIVTRLTQQKEYFCESRAVPSDLTLYLAPLHPILFPYYPHPMRFCQRDATSYPLLLTSKTLALLHAHDRLPGTLPVSGTAAGEQVPQDDRHGYLILGLRFRFIIHLDNPDQIYRTLVSGAG